MDVRSPAELDKIVTRYVKVVQRNRPCNEIRDVSSLPWPKDVIIDACLQYLAKNKNPNIRDTVSGSLLLLSFYQEGVGDKPLTDCRFDHFPMDINSVSDAEMTRLKEIVAENLPHLDPDHFLRLLRLVQADFRKIDAACEAITRT